MHRSILFPNLVSNFFCCCCYQLFEFIVWETDYLCLICFFQGLSLALLIEKAEELLSSYLTFSVSMNLGKTVIYCGLEGGVFMWEHSYVDNMCPTSLV